MNRVMRVLVISVGLLPCAAGQQANAQDIEDIQLRFESEDMYVRAAALRDLLVLGVQNYAEVSKTLVEKGLLDSKPVVQEVAVHGYIHLILSSPHFAEDATDINIARRLLRLVMRTCKPRIAGLASQAYLAVFGATEELENAVVQRVSVDRRPSTISRVLKIYRFHEITDENHIQIIREIVIDTPPGDGSIAAIRVLHKAGDDPEFLVKEIVRLVSTDKLFVHPALVKILPQYASYSAQYVLNLRALHSTLLDQLQLDRSNRSVTIYNDSYYQETLESTIESLEQY